MLKLPFIPMERTVEVTVPPEVSAPVALIDYLSSRYDYLDRDQWLEQIAIGNLFVNRTGASAARLVAPGDAIFFQARDLTEQEVSWEIKVLAETDEYIIVDKPGNLPCHPAGRFFNHTLWAWLRQARHLQSIHFVNRLDRETSGVVLVGKSPRFAAAAAKSLHAKGDGSRKEYTVMVHGRVPCQKLATNGFLARDPSSAVRKKRAFIPMQNDGDSDVVELPEDVEAVTSQTDFVRVGFFRPQFGNDGMAGSFAPDEKGGFTMLRAFLHTGRTHQIRATLCSLGFPVAGDKLYGLDERLFLKFAASTLEMDDWRRLMMRHQALHARRLAIPALGIDVTAPTPWIPPDAGM